MLKKIKSLFARKNKSKSSEYAWNSPNYVPTYAGGFGAAAIANREDTTHIREARNEFVAAGGFGAANRNMLNTW